MNCKPGDLAYIVSASPDTKGWNDGRVVEVLHVYIDHHVHFGRVWQVRSQTPLSIFDGFTGAPIGTMTEFQCPDDWLRPISGVPVHDDLHDEVPA
ncbi:hypothetical protein ACUXAV_000675 [Cupriavidus metallidurans]|uniref:hypothetical protein n=1 Tax=Cupriavidus metallidurans TaxID=119219 RepID=UPI0004936644|nr:hypothetical protein [Cupriavidus metallidurans]MDE4918576.1 hypothetical protein [Cupriavidus metallidurans]